MAERAVPVEREPYAERMDTSTAKRIKVTVRLSPERMDRARKAVERGKAPSISAWVEEALRKHDSSFGWCTSWQEAFDEIVREENYTDEEVACLRRELADLLAP
jgi:Arc/MetJ-type ribon-helix-helix transcriptional regulator